MQSVQPLSSALYNLPRPPRREWRNIKLYIAFSIIGKYIILRFREQTVLLFGKKIKGTSILFFFSHWFIYSLHIVLEKYYLSSEKLITCICMALSFISISHYVTNNEENLNFLKQDCFLLSHLAVKTSIYLANFSRVNDGNCPSSEITGRNRHSYLKQRLTRVHRSTRWTASPSRGGREGERDHFSIYVNSGLPRRSRFHSPGPHPAAC